MKNNKNIIQINNDFKEIKDFLQKHLLDKFTQTKQIKLFKDIKFKYSGTNENI